MRHDVAMAKNEISRSATAHIPPFGLRLQPALKERLEEAARAANRSMNAELTARLEASFTLEQRIAELTAEMRRLIEEDTSFGVQRLRGKLAETERNEKRSEALIEALSTALQGQRGLIRLLGFYLGELASRVDGNASTRQLMRTLASIGNALAHDETSNAVAHVQELVRVGKEAGIIGADGQVNPEFEHLRPPDDAGPPTTRQKRSRQK